MRHTVRNVINLTRWMRLLFLICVSAICFAQPPAGTSNLVYVGTYTDHGSKGIYYYRFDSKTGQLKPLGLAAETSNPSFLVLDAKRRLLYAANETDSYKDEATGSVSAFAIHEDGKLSLLNQVSSKGPGPAYVTMDRTGKYVLVANYSKGNIAVFPVLGNGDLGEASAFVQHKGSSVNADRQSGPHAHAIVLSPDNRFALVADLGIDQVLAYPFDASKGALGQPRITRISPGSGPRHLSFDRSGKFVYLINEMRSDITVFFYNPANGALSELQTISTLPKDFAGQSTAAEIEVHPSGKFLYASNRGHDSIAVFAISESGGKLTPIEYVSTQGKTPRHFAIDPTGKWLLAANQDSNNIVIFRINAVSGRLTPNGQVIQIPSPVCIKFLKNAVSKDRR